MPGYTSRALAGVLCMSSALAIAGSRLGAQAQPVEVSNEARFQLDLHVNDAAIAAMLPAGFSLNVATQGPAKDCNLRLVFVDRLTIHGPDGKTVGKGSGRLAYLAAPVKDASGANAQLVIGGLVADPADAPGYLGVYLPAATHSMQRSTASNGAGVPIDSQDWVFHAATGEHLEMHIKYEHGMMNKGNPNEVKFYSAKNPSTLQTWRQEQILDIIRNPTTNPPDKVKEFSLKLSGGSYSKIFDGTERVVSWDNMVWINRTILQ
jgi:hypothetical protein